MEVRAGFWDCFRFVSSHVSTYCFSLSYEFFWSSGAQTRFHCLFQSNIITALLVSVSDEVYILTSWREAAAISGCERVSGGIAPRPSLTRDCGWPDSTSKNVILNLGQRSLYRNRHISICRLWLKLRSIITMGLSRTVSEINGSRKSPIFLTPVYLTSPPLGIWYRRGVDKN